MKNTILLVSLAIVLVLCVALISCADEETPDTTEYILIISSTDGGDSNCIPPLGCTCGEGTEDSGGLSVPEECLCAEGTEISIEATPDPGYWFVGWSGDVETIAHVKAAKTTIVMNDDYSIIANFVKQYNLTISSTTGGSVTMPGEATYTYDEGKVVDLEAQAEDGYHFVNWTGDVDTIDDVNAHSTTITINGDYETTANFEMTGWVRNPINGHYYKVTERLAWPDAEAQAVAWGGHLATINDEMEELWLRSTFGASEPFWIGFNDIAVEGEWVWVSGEPVTWTNWDEGEPTNAGYPNITNEDVAVMNETPGSETGYGWNDVPRTRLDRGIVEVPEKPSP